MLLAALLMLAAQDTAPARPEAAADGAQRWSILVDPCASARSNDDSVVVCAKAVDTPRVPLPGDRGPPDRPMPSNPNLSGSGALMVSADPCATRSEGCTVGIDLLGSGTAVIRAVGKLIDSDSCCERPGEATNPAMLVGDVAKAVGKVFRKKPDKSKRVPILFDDLPPEEPAARAP